MAAVKSVEVEVEGTKDLALIARDGSVWLVVPIRWWDLSTLIWWAFVPADRKANVKIRMYDQTKVQFKAVRVASRHVRVYGFQ